MIILEFKEGDFVICLVSRALPEKGWKEAVEAVEQANKISDRDIHLILIGEGEMYDLLKETESKFIHVLGSKSDIRSYFAMSDIGLLPSRYPGESYPLVVIDSLMCEKPVIATDLGEIKNQLMTEDGKIAGILLCLNNWTIDISELRDAIIKLATDRILYDELVERTKSASKKFDISVVARKYLSIYMEALKQ